MAAKPPERRVTVPESRSWTRSWRWASAAIHLPVEQICGGLQVFSIAAPTASPSRRHRDLCWRHMVEYADDCRPRVHLADARGGVEASGHLTGFVDPLRQCLGEWALARRPCWGRVPRGGGPLDDARLFGLMFKTRRPLEDRASQDPRTAPRGMFVDFKNESARQGPCAVQDRPARQGLRNEITELRLSRQRVRVDGDGVLVCPPGRRGFRLLAH